MPVVVSTHASSAVALNQTRIGESVRVRERSDQRGGWSTCRPLGVTLNSVPNPASPRYGISVDPAGRLAGGMVPFSTSKAESGVCVAFTLTVQLPVALI